MSQDGVSAPPVQETAFRSRWRLPLFAQRCPRCDSDQVWRSHRRSGWERFLGLLVLPHRCQFCSFRFFRAKWIGE